MHGGPDERIGESIRRPGKREGEWADAYGRLKERLAEEYPYDIEGYCDGKDEFVKELERRALAWALDR